MTVLHKVTGSAMHLKRLDIPKILITGSNRDESAIPAIAKVDLAIVPCNYMEPSKILKLS